MPVRYKPVAPEIKKGISNFVVNPTKFDMPNTNLCLVCEIIKKEKLIQCFGLAGGKKYAHTESKMLALVF